MARKSICSRTNDVFVKEANGTEWIETKNIDFAVEEYDFFRQNEII